MNPQPRILVMGAGGIGGIVAAMLTEVGWAVTAVSTNERIRAAVDRAGYRITEEGEERTIRGWVSPAPEGRYDLCILATQPPNVEAAAATALPHLADDARVVVPGRYERTAAGGFQIGRSRRREAHGGEAPRR